MTEHEAAPQAEPLRLPLPKPYLTEDEVVHILGTSKEALRRRPSGQRPPCIQLSPRRRIYDRAEFEAWIQSLPRSK